MAARIMAALGGIASAIAALYFLVDDALRSGVWTADHVGPLFLVPLSIVVGYLCEASVRDITWWNALGKLIRAAGFAALFALVSYGLVLSNVGRLSKTMDQSHLKASDVNERRAVTEQALRRHRRMLDEELALRSSACPADIDSRSTSERKQCQSKKDSVSVYEQTVKGDLSDLAKIGPGVAEDSRAEKLAALVRLLGGSASNTKEVVEATEPFVLPLIFELGSILCFGFSFAPWPRLERGVGLTPFQPPVPTPDQPESNPPESNPPFQPPVPTRKRPTGRLFSLIRGGLDSGVGLAVVPTLNQPTETNPWTTLVSLADQGLVSTPQTKLYTLLGFKTRAALRDWLKEQEACGKVEVKADRLGTVIRIK